MSKTVPWTITVEAVILYETDPLLWDAKVLMNQVNEAVQLGYGTVESTRLMPEAPDEDAIDHAQTTLREFEDDTPDIPGTTAYTPPVVAWRTRVTPRGRERNALGQYVTGDGVRDELGRFTDERANDEPRPSNNPQGKPQGSMNHCTKCGAVNRNRKTCLARFSRTRSGMKHRKRGNGRVFKTPDHVRRQYPDRRWSDRHHRDWH